MKYTCSMFANQCHEQNSGFLPGMRCEMGGHDNGSRSKPDPWLLDIDVLWLNLIQQDGTGLACDIMTPWCRHSTDARILGSWH